MAVGVGVALLSYGVFGTARAGRSLLDPIMVDTVAADPVLWRAIAIAGGIVLAEQSLADLHALATSSGVAFPTAAAG